MLSATSLILKDLHTALELLEKGEAHRAPGDAAQIVRKSLESAVTRTINLQALITAREKEYADAARGGASPDSRRR